MTVAPGSRLGVFEIVAPLGVGGMGEVYRARDTKLGREVAIKVVPDELTHDRERLQRFEREARLLAGLNHPNIATLHGLESIDDRQLLVMELVGGETLAERIARGPVPIDEAVIIFQQIAEGLGAAHDKGVVHRDLKPANIKIAPDGTVKILDFGLAKAADPDDAPADDLSQSPTLSKGTAMGVILGTAPYMSPEQARGKAVDKRTDLWAFGCCLFEALTGARPFEGATVTDTLAAIVKETPRWEKLPAETPRALRALLEHCLDKDAKRRARDAWDVRRHLVAKDTTSDVSVRKRSAAVPAAIAGVIVGALLVWAVSSPVADQANTTRLEIFLEHQALATQRGVTVPVALSPDGTRLVYAADAGATTQLFERRLDRFDVRAIPNTEGANRPFFSPDGEWVGFSTSGDQPTLVKVSLQGGGRSLLDENAGSGNWSDDGSIIYPGLQGLSSIPASGGEPTVWTERERDERHSLPAWIPDGAGVVFTLGSARGSRIAVISEPKGEWKLLEELGNGGSARYLPTGHLVYAQQGALVAVPFDIDELEVTGAPTPVVEDVATRTVNLREVGLYAVSAAGHLAYVPGEATIQRQLVWVDRYGRETPASRELGPYEYPDIAPDGTRLAITRHDFGHQAWAFDLVRETVTRLTTDVSQSNEWAPDGLTLAQVLNSRSLVLIAADGSGTIEPWIQAANDEDYLRAGSWAPDGSFLYVVAYFDNNHDIRIRRPDGTIEDVIATPFKEYHPELSPDGRFLAYTSNESGVEEVYVRPFPSLERQTIISTGGGREPRWSPDGTELYYRRDGGVYAVSIRTEPAFAAGNPELLFEGDFHITPGGAGNNQDYDISPDGERFLMIRAEAHPKEGSA